MANGIKVVNAGLANTTNRIKGAGTEPTYIIWGIGTTTPAVTDTNIQTAAAETTRVNATSSRTTVNATNDTWTLVGTVISTATQAITEFGNFDASSSGNMDVHAVFSAFNVVNLDSIAFTLNKTFISA